MPFDGKSVRLFQIAFGCLERTHGCISQFSTDPAVHMVMCVCSVIIAGRAVFRLHLAYDFLLGKQI